MSDWNSRPRAERWSLIGAVIGIALAVGVTSGAGYLVTGIAGAAGGGLGALAGRFAAARKTEG